MENSMSAKPKVQFFVWSSFDYGSRIGSYYMLMKYNTHRKVFEAHNIAGHSPNHLMLLAVKEALGQLTKPCEIEILSSTPLGLSNIYDKSGNLRETADGKHNWEEKEAIRFILEQKKHSLTNRDERAIVQILMNAGCGIQHGQKAGDGR